MRISDWCSDVCSSDLTGVQGSCGPTRSRSPSPGTAGVTWSSLTPAGLPGGTAMGPSTTTTASTPTGAAPGPEVAAAGPMPELVPPDQWADPTPHYHRLRHENQVWSIPEWDEVVGAHLSDWERGLPGPRATGKGRVGREGCGAGRY